MTENHALSPSRRMLMNELADLETRALSPPLTRKHAIAEANRRRALLALPLLTSSTVSDWFKKGIPARDFATLWALIEVLTEWAHSRSRTGQRDQVIVKQMHQRKWRLLWEDARAEQLSSRPVPQADREAAEPTTAAVGAEPPRLAQLILSTYIDRSIDVSDMLGSSLAKVPRAENRVGWHLLPPVPLTWAESSWPIRHHSHRVGFLKWIRDNHGHTGWELAVPDGRWEEEEHADVHGYPVDDWPYWYLLAPPAKRADGGRGWADPADALWTLADLHYCPRTALTTLFRLVDEGVTADEASRIVHIVPAVGEHLVQRAQCRRPGRPLLEQADDFLPLRESDWEVGIIR